MRKAKDDFVRWNRGLAEFEKLAAEHVYGNPDFTLLDARQHRAMLLNLMAEGEFLALRFLGLQMPPDAESYVTFLDGRMEALAAEYLKWHGPNEAVDVIPEDFTVAMREIAAGKAVDLDQVLKETLPAA